MSLTLRCECGSSLDVSCLLGSWNGETPCVELEVKLSLLGYSGTLGVLDTRLVEDVLVNSFTVKINFVLSIPNQATRNLNGLKSKSYLERKALLAVFLLANISRQLEGGLLGPGVLGVAHAHAHLHRLLSSSHVRSLKKLYFSTCYHKAAGVP